MSKHGDLVNNGKQGGRPVASASGPREQKGQAGTGQNGGRLPPRGGSGTAPPKTQK